MNAHCNECRYCCLTRGKLFDHWNLHHKSISCAVDNRFHMGSVQTLFKPKPLRYFDVNPLLLAPPSLDIFDMFLSAEVPLYKPFPVLIPSQACEIPPLLVTTQWHEHLKLYLTDRTMRVNLWPKKIASTKLWDVTWAYI
jgi:hypothetical protein